jgi:hypothetical protein
MDVRRLALLQSHATLINVGRGGLIDEAALHDALHHRQLGVRRPFGPRTRPPPRGPHTAMRAVACAPGKRKRMHVGGAPCVAQGAVLDVWWRYPTLERPDTWPSELPFHELPTDRSGPRVIERRPEARPAPRMRI